VFAEMRYLAAYLLCVLGGEESPSAETVAKVLAAGGVTVNDFKLRTCIAAMERRELGELIKQGSEKLPNDYQLCLSSMWEATKRYDSQKSRSTPQPALPLRRELPDAVWTSIFCFSCRSATDAMSIGLVCNRFRNIVVPCHNAVKLDPQERGVIVSHSLPIQASPCFVLWEQLARRRWPHISANLRIKRGNWLWFYAARAAKLKNEESGMTTIENCSSGIDLELLVDRVNPFILKNSLPQGFRWKFRCPVSFSSLGTTNDHKIRRCSVCDENVYLVDNETELRSEVAVGHCAAFSFTSRHEEYELGGIDEACVNLFGD